MRNFKQVKKTLSSFFKDSKEVSGGIGKLIPYITILTTGAVIGGGVLTFGAVLVASAAAVEGISAILAVLSSKKENFGNQERFEIYFHLLCHQSYALALKDALKDLRKIADVKIRTDELKQLSGPTIEETMTSWDYDLDSSSYSNPLFETYDKYLNLLLVAAKVDSKKIETILSKINEEARSNLFKLMSKPTEPYDWMYRYVQLKELIKARKASDSLPVKIGETIQKATEGFLDKVERRSVEAWKQYRKQLEELPSKEIFGSDFGIEKLYVLPNFTYYRARSTKLSHNPSLEEKQELPLRSNLPVFLAHLISTRTSRDNLIFIFGDPGIGKTSLAQMFAAGLARNESFHPIFIPLQNVDPTADLLAEIEKFIDGTFLRDTRLDLPYCSNVVFILDAFDELAQATRERMGDFFRRLEEFSREGIYRNASIIATGRHTLFTRDDIMIPSNTHVITLQPFEKDQIEEWSNKWNKLTSQNFDGINFWKEKEGGDLREIATQPLLLYLLAKLEAEGEKVDPSRMEMSRSEVYRHIIQWCCDRHNELRAKRHSITFTGTDMRHFLRVAGFCTMAFGSGSIHIDQLQEMLGNVGLTPEAVQKKENYEAQQTFLSFTFHKVGQSSWEFKHKSFSEYLAAEYIGEALGRTIAEKEDSDLPGHYQWEIKDGEVAILWAELFARNTLTPEVQLYLGPMLGCWTEFIRNEDYENRPKGLKRLLDRCGPMYVRFVREKDMEHLTNIARQSGIEPTRALVNFGMATLILGSYCARSLSTESEKAYFEVERVCPNGWWKMLNAIMRYADFSNIGIARRLFLGVSLVSDEGILFPGNYCPGVLLPFLRISKMRKNEDIYGFTLELPGSVFYGSDLRNIDLGRADLTGAHLEEANLREATWKRLTWKGLT